MKKKLLTAGLSGKAEMSSPPERRIFGPHMGLKGVDLRSSWMDQRGSLVVETPVRLTGTRIFCDSPTTVGAFTYTCRNTKMHMVKSIGRFCSVAEGVVFQNGGHGTEILSNSPVFTGELDSMVKGFASLDPQWQKQVNQERKKNSHVECIIEVGHDVWIGTGAIILAGVTIGTGAVIGAGAVVTHSIPPYAVAAGVPARVLRLRFPEKTIGKLLESRWWEYGPEILQGLDFLNVERSIDTVMERIAAGFPLYRPNTYELLPPNDPA